MHIRHTQLFIATALIGGGIGVAGCGSSSPAVVPDAAPADAVPPPDAALTRAGLTNVGTNPAPLDYSNPALWLCRPDIGSLNECARDIDSTLIALDNTQSAAPEAAEVATAPFDCFYVYPTVTFNPAGGNQANDTDFSSVNDQLDALLGQAARFRKICPIYAPLYRQVAIAANGALDPNSNPALGLADTRAAFAYYMAHFNNGRPFVFIGHSQGSAVLEALIELDVDVKGKEAVLGQMISAVLLGGNVRVPLVANATVATCVPGGATTDCQTFATIKPCASSTDEHCVVAYSSYRVTAPPSPPTALFGAQTAHTKVVCTNPSELAGNAGLYAGSYIPNPATINNKIFVPDGTFPTGVTTPFALERNKFAGTCVENTFTNAANNTMTTYDYLQITPLAQSAQAGADMRPIPPYASAASESLGFGEHIFDFAFEQDDLITLVQKQAAAF